MSEFGLELPPTTKLGEDGKGEKAFIIGQSKVAAVLGVVAVLAIFSGGIYMSSTASNAKLLHVIEQEQLSEKHQFASKIEAETKMAEMSAEMHKMNEKSRDQESDLKIMASHLQYVQQVSLINIMQSIDDESLTVADIKKTVNKQFKEMEKETEQILHDHLVVVEGANAKSNAEMDRIEAEVQEMTQAQQKYDEEMAEKKKAAGAAPSEPSAEETKMIESRIDAIFTHVYDLAEKMGDADIDGLLDADKVQEWEQVLTDAETGKLAYPKAVEKMEEIITNAPAALKLAEVTSALQLIEEDGGAKGVTEVTNFRNLLKEVKWLPQYAAVLEEFSQWKQGTKTVQQVLAWTEGKLAAGEIDGTWLAKAYETTTKAGAAAATATKPGTASTSNAAAAAAVATKAAPAATAATAAKAAQRDM
jgi:uncharacterized protein YoxC